MNHLIEPFHCCTRCIRVIIKTSFLLFFFYLFLLPPTCLLLGLRCIYLHLFCTGNGDKDGGSGDLWSSLLPGRHLEPTGLFHRHGWVSNCFMSAWALILNYRWLLEWMDSESVRLSTFTHCVTGQKPLVCNNLSILILACFILFQVVISLNPSWHEAQGYILTLSYYLEIWVITSLCGV